MAHLSEPQQEGMCHASLETESTFPPLSAVCLRQCSEKRREQVGGGGLHSHMVRALPKHRSNL